MVKVLLPRDLMYLVMPMHFENIHYTLDSEDCDQSAPISSCLIQAHTILNSRHFVSMFWAMVVTANIKIINRRKEKKRKEERNRKKEKKGNQRLKNHNVSH